MKSSLKQDEEVDNRELMNVSSSSDSDAEEPSDLELSSDDAEAKAGKDNESDGEVSSDGNNFVNPLAKKTIDLDG